MIGWLIDCFILGLASPPPPSLSHTQPTHPPHTPTHTRLPLSHPHPHTKQQEALTHAIRRAELPYEGESTYYRWLAREFRRKRDVLASALREAGIEPMESQVCYIYVVVLVVDGWGVVHVNDQAHTPNTPHPPLSFLNEISTGRVFPPRGRVGRLGARRLPARRYIIVYIHIELLSLSLFIVCWGEYACPLSCVLKVGPLLLE